MAENLTQPTDADVDAFLDSVPDERRRAEGHALRRLMERVTGQEPVMWGPTMVGFGKEHYRYESGREGDQFVVGFSPRKAALTLYGLNSPGGEPDPLMAQLGPHTTGKSCVYVKRLDAVNADVLERLIRRRLEQAAT
ncbi:DUF1801 domain-containing protein [Lysobacter korlensis]|uniref:DUF1801 domain-containing protein n=1 Tax=Lysobacter korlensis TaxID=553636 RepID=A0ABV6RU04_9GAMM